MKNLMAAYILLLMTAALGSAALADEPCQAKDLNGKWSCQGANQPLVFDVSKGADGIFKMNPTKSLGITIILDGKLHEFNMAGMTLTTTGSCAGNVVTIKGNNNGLMDFDEIFTLKSTKIMVITADLEGQPITTNCTK